MRNLGEVMAELQRRIKSKPPRNVESESLSNLYDCKECKDTGFVIERVELPPLPGSNKPNYRDHGRECECQEKKLAEARIKNAMIPEEFKDCRFDNYERKTKTQQTMYDGMIEYLKNISENMGTSRNSLGFIAAYGESMIRSLPPLERNDFRQAHNSYGLGKSHLKMAAARYLVNNVKVTDKHNGLSRHCRVLCISDLEWIEDLMHAKKENTIEYQKMLDTAINWADVLVWDDLGKSKHTEARERLYYRIINDRYKLRKPIIFSSNEDADGIEDHIGFAAADRLFGMSRDHLYELEGDSYRTN